MIRVGNIRTEDLVNLSTGSDQVPPCPIHLSTDHKLTAHPVEDDIDVSKMCETALKRTLLIHYGSQSFLPFHQPHNVPTSVKLGEGTCAWLSLGLFRISCWGFLVSFEEEENWMWAKLDGKTRKHSTVHVCRWIIHPSRFTCSRVKTELWFYLNKEWRATGWVYPSLWERDPDTDRRNQTIPCWLVGSKAVGKDLGGLCELIEVEWTGWWCKVDRYEPQKVGPVTSPACHLISNMWARY